MPEDRHDPGGSRRFISALDTRTIHVACGVLIHPQRPGEALMCLRGPMKDRPMLWEFPGGKIDPGDRGPRSAVAREWREELALDVVAGERIATGIVNADVRVLIEMFEVTSADPLSFEVLDHEEARWVSPRFAVRHLPCSPAFYAHFPFLDLWMAHKVVDRPG